MSIVADKKELDGYMWSGDVVTSLFCGDKQVWPEVTGRNAVHIEWPEKGTTAWALMRYALWVNRRFPDSSRVKIWFYINDASYYVDGRDSRYESIQMEGNVLFFSEAQKARLVGKVPESISFGMTTPKFVLIRFNAEGETVLERLIGLPLISADFTAPLLEMKGTVSSDGGAGNLHIELVGEPSKVVHSQVVVPIAVGDSEVIWEAKNKQIFKDEVSLGKALDGSYFSGDYGFRARVWCDAPDVRGTAELYFNVRQHSSFSVKVSKAF